MTDFELPRRRSRPTGISPPNKIEYPAPCLRCDATIDERPKYKHRICRTCRAEDAAAYYSRNRERILDESKRYWRNVRLPRLLLQRKSALRERIQELENELCVLKDLLND
jgi:hypothetical protein